MKTSNIEKLVEATKNVPAAKFYNSWTAVVQWLDRKGFNAWEIEAILKSDLLKFAVLDFGHPKSKNSHKHTTGYIGLYFNKKGIVHHCPQVNALVLQANPEFKGNEQGIPCEEGTCPGGSDGVKTLVPVGTSACCNPHTETYWSL